MKITYLIGLPGSGKSTYGRRLDGLFLDDLTQHGGIGRLRTVPVDTQHLILSDIGFTDPRVFASAQRVVAGIIPITEKPEFVYWENDPVQCHSNIMARGDGRHVTLGFLKFLSDFYVLPKDVTPRPVKY